MAQLILTAWREDESHSISFYKAVQEEEPLGVLQLPEPSQWGHGSPNLHELRARIVDSLQGHACGAGLTAGACLVHVQRNDGLLVPLASDAMLQKALATWQQAPGVVGADTAALKHKLFVSQAMLQAGTPGTEASTPGTSMVSGAHAPSPRQTSPSMPASSNQTVSAHGPLSMHQTSTADTHGNEFGHLPMLRTEVRSMDPKEDQAGLPAAAGLNSAYSSNPNTPFSHLSMASRTQDNMPWEGAGTHGQSFLDLHGQGGSQGVSPARTPAHTPMHGSMGGAHGGRPLSRLAPQPPAVGLSLAEATYQRLTGSAGFSSSATHASNLAPAMAPQDMPFMEHSADAQLHAAHRLQQQAMPQPPSPVTSRSQGAHAAGGPVLSSLAAANPTRHPSVITTGSALGQAKMAHVTHVTQPGACGPGGLTPASLIQEGNGLAKAMGDGNVMLRQHGETSDPGAGLLSGGVAAMMPQTVSAARRAVTTGGSTPRAATGVGASLLPSMPSIGAASSLGDGDLHTLGTEMLSGDDDGGRGTPRKGAGGRGGRGGRGGMAGRVIKSRESTTKYADGRKKDDQHHLASMAVMTDACNNMFGSLSHLVQVDDYKHIRCLACTPHCVVKTYSAYHTACIRKHFLRHHSNLLSSSDVDLSNFKEYKEKMNKAKNGTSSNNNHSGDGDDGCYEHSLRSTPSVSRSLIGTFGGVDVAGSPGGTPRSRPQRRAYRATIDVPSASWDHATSHGGLGNGITTGLRLGAASMGGLGVHDAFSGSTSLGGSGSPASSYFPGSATFAAGALGPAGLRAPVRHIITHHPAADNEMSHLGSPFLHMGSDAQLKQQGLQNPVAGSQGGWPGSGLGLAVPPPPGHHQLLNSNLNSNNPITWAGPANHHQDLSQLQRMQGSGDLGIGARLGVTWGPNSANLTASAAANALMSSVTTGAANMPLALQSQQQLLRSGRAPDVHMQEQWNSLDSASNATDQFLSLGMHGAADSLRKPQLQGSPACSFGGAGDQQVFQGGSHAGHSNHMQLERTLASSMQHLQHLMHVQNMHVRSSGGGAQQLASNLHGMQHSHGDGSPHDIPVPQLPVFDMGPSHALSHPNNPAMRTNIIQHGSTAGMGSQQPSPYNSMDQQAMANFLSNFRKDADGPGIQHHTSGCSSAEPALITRNSNGILAALNMDRDPVLPGSPLQFHGNGATHAATRANPAFAHAGYNAAIRGPVGMEGVTVGMDGVTDSRMASIPDMGVGTDIIGLGSEGHTVSLDLARNIAGGGFSLGAKRPASTAVSTCSIQDVTIQDGANDDDDDGFGFASDGLQNYSYDQFLSGQGSELEAAIVQANVEETAQELQL